MKPDLSVSRIIRGKPFTLQNPIISAPGGLGNLIEFRDFLDLTAMGALVPNSLMLHGGAPSPNNKFLHTPHGYLSSFGPNNISLEEFISRVIPQLPERHAPIIVDLKAASMEDMISAAGLAGESGAIAAVEVNLICPYGVPGTPYWQDAGQLEALMTGVREAVGDKPLIVKVPGDFFPFSECAAILEACGTDMIVSFNSLSGCSVDVRRRTVQGGGYFGAGIKPFALSRCREAVSVFRIPVIGAGGITCGRDVLEYIMAGAFAVQIGSASLARPDAMERILEELEILMEELGIASLDQVRGAAKPVAMDLFQDN